MNDRPAPAWFIAGTDTEIGKTLVACALLHKLRAKFPRVVGAKPVAAGLEPSGVNADVRALRAASNVPVPAELDNPYALAEPVSPHLAARAEGKVIDLHRIASSVARLRTMADAVVVEGVGGLLVPLSDTADGGDLARLLRLPVVLVVGLKLGCLNHALLTQEAIATRGLHFAGWVGNQIDPDMLRADDNLTTLRSRLRAPCLGVIPHMAEPDAAQAASFLELPT
ncbi:MAG: dethiobiotin synthase [Thiomonas sp.]|uniref:Dethiobiotin synthetase (Dethiobiotin synthase) (DTB synthetase) (DTBS) n=1 Tax=mine drainage metagenome TaxID=410659 RepID=E6PMJ9_9ZZZZ